METYTKKSISVIVLILTGQMYTENHFGYVQKMTSKNQEKFKVDKIQETLSIISEKITHYPYIIAVDGRSGAGKTALAERMKTAWNCTVIHTDDFFLRPQQQTQERYDTPGENIDHERFQEEVILPLKEGMAFSYRPYDCRLMALKPPIAVFPKNIIVIEGSYCCHRELWKYYDLHIFIDIDKERQKERIKQRNGENAEMFFERWIPLEEAYFSECGIKEKCELVFDL